MRFAWTLPFITLAACDGGTPSQPPIQNDIMVRSEQQAGPIAFEPFANCVDLARLRFLFRNEVIQAKHHQCVCVGQHPFVNRQLVPRLIDALEHRDRMPRRLSHDRLE